MNTAIVGLGNIGSRLAANLTAGEESIIVAERTLAKAEQLAANLGGKARGTSVEDALQSADIVIDPSNPIAPDGKGGFKKTIPAEQSSGMIIVSLLPESVQLVKAFGTLSAQSRGAAANRLPERAVLFYATDYPSRQSCCEAHRGERIRARWHRRDRSVNPHRSGRRSA
jgi:predicted dinucleotide-binding enzyme